LFARQERRAGSGNSVLSLREDTPFQRVDQAGWGDLGREVHQRVHVAGLAVELRRFALEAGAHVLSDLRHAFPVCR
jgi:hypothetical protein